MGRPARVACFLAVAVAGVVCDQLTKEAMRGLLAGGARRVLVPGIMDLVLVENTSAAFSIGEGAGAAFALVALAVAVGALVWVAREDDMHAPLVVSLACVAGGGVGNMLDRLLRGSVTDFLCTTFMDFPVFNVADILVTLGVIATLVLVARQDRLREQGQGEQG